MFLAAVLLLLATGAVADDQMVVFLATHLSYRLVMGLSALSVVGFVST